MRRCSSKISSPLAALPLFLLLLLVCSSSFHCAAAARLLPAVPLPPLTAENGAKAAAAAAAAAASDGGLVLQSAAVASGDELSVSSESEVMGAEAAAEGVVACEEGNDDECFQRRLLLDAHLDYIYTQHKGKP